MSTKNNPNSHISGSSIRRERYPVTFVESISHNADGFSLRVEAVDLVREVWGWAEAQEGAVPGVLLIVTKELGIVTRRT